MDVHGEPGLSDELEVELEDELEVEPEAGDEPPEEPEPSGPVQQLPP